ncbi:hypothetical protein FM107_01375 [Sphingobacterium sp. JB170]|nr:hypothetical protein FM107_01375 [Sphingobacterium sp. JB170]
MAFYSESIIPTGGPESFCGLPGMILGVALPHENVSWFATKVTPMNIQKVPQQQVERKKKPITKSEFQKLLKERTENWGTYQTEAQKAFSF